MVAGYVIVKAKEDVVTKIKRRRKEDSSMLPVYAAWWKWESLSIFQDCKSAI